MHPPSPLEHPSSPSLDPSSVFDYPTCPEYLDLHDPIALGVAQQSSSAPSTTRPHFTVTWVEGPRCPTDPPPPSLASHTPAAESEDGDRSDEPAKLSRAAVLKYDVAVPVALLVVHFAVYILYSFLVGLVFLTIEEQPNETYITQNYEAFIAQGFSPDEVLFLQQNYGLGLPYNQSTRQWDYLSAQYYVITYSSTIGYGDFVPRTVAGKFLTFFFGLLGLPLMGYVFITAGSLFVRFAVTALLLCLSLCMGLRFQMGSEGETAVRLMAQIDREITMKDLRHLLDGLEGGSEPVKWLEVCRLMEVADVNLSGTLDRREIEKALRYWAKRKAEADIRSNPLMLMYVFLLLVSWLSFSASIFAILEGYQWSTGWWFGYITLTTIGFGDRVATNTKSRLFWILFVYFGVGLMSWLVVALAERVVGITRRVVRTGLRFSYRYQLAWEPRAWERFLRRLAPLWIPITGLVGYALLGDVMFLAYEEAPSRSRYQLSQMAYSNANLTASQREYLRNTLPKPTIWSFPQAFMFCMVSITTIGYGNTVPTTPAAKSLLIVYTFFGVGLVAYFLGQLANVFTEGLIWLVATLTRLVGKEYLILREEDFEEWAQRLFAGVADTGHTTKGSAAQDLLRVLPTLHPDELLEAVPHAGSPEEQPSQEHLVGMARLLTRKRRQMILVYFGANLAALSLLCPIFAGIYVGLEKWPYANALWFCYITLTTIGFGDYVPTTTESAIFTVFAVLINMGFFANCLTMAAPLFQTLTIISRNAWHRRRQGKKGTKAA